MALAADQQKNVTSVIIKGKYLFSNAFSGSLNAKYQNLYECSGTNG